VIARGPVRRLTIGEYTDIHKKLKRMLKQMGAGSLQEGIKDLRKNGKMQNEVAKLIGATHDVSEQCQEGHGAEEGARHECTPNLHAARVL
jgi:hypothetical protein